MAEGELYDVVCQLTRRELSVLGNLRIRYLSYESSKPLTLSHPDDLLSLSVYTSQITNLREAVNL